MSLGYASFLCFYVIIGIGVPQKILPEVAHGVIRLALVGGAYLLGLDKARQCLGIILPVVNIRQCGIRIDIGRHIIVAFLDILDE